MARTSEYLPSTLPRSGTGGDLPRRINGLGTWQPLLGAVGGENRIESSANSQPDSSMPPEGGKKEVAAMFRGRAKTLNGEEIQEI